MLQFVPIVAFGLLAVSLSKYKEKSDESGPSEWSDELKVALAHIAVAEALVRMAATEADPAKKEAQLNQAWAVSAGVVKMLEKPPLFASDAERGAHQVALDDARRLTEQLEHELAELSNKKIHWTVWAGGLVLVGVGCYFLSRRA